MENEHEVDAQGPEVAEEGLDVHGEIKIGKLRIEEDKKDEVLIADSAGNEEKFQLPGARKLLKWAVRHHSELGGLEPEEFLYVYVFRKAAEETEDTNAFGPLAAKIRQEMYQDKDQEVDSLMEKARKARIDWDEVERDTELPHE